MKRPNSMRHLDDAIRRACGGAPDAYIQARTMMANAIVASMLPDGVIKGGSALKMRFGDKTTRFTTDLDTATSMDPVLYAERLGQRLKAGWEGLYAEQSFGLPVLPNVDEALEWANSFIRDTDKAREGKSSEN